MVTTEHPTDEEEDDSGHHRSGVKKTDAFGTRAPGNGCPVDNPEERSDQATDDAQRDQVISGLRPSASAASEKQDVEDNGPDKRSKRNDDQLLMNRMAE